MGVKKNFAYNSFLTVSNYVINLILFPFCTRVLGVERYGTVGFAQNIVQYFSFLAMMGITTIGVREIAKHSQGLDRDRCFSSLFLLNLLYTLVSLCCFVPLIFLVSRFSVEKELFVLGAFQVLCTTFCIEWFFKGIENFKYITIRNIIVKVIYLIAVFIFVRSSDDYVLFYLLTVGVTLVNALINFLYSRKFVRFSLRGVSLRPYIGSTLSLGAYSLLTSMYTTFNVIYLGFVQDDAQVGYYTAAIKVYTVILGFYSAFTGVMLPRMTAIQAGGDETGFNALINKSLNLLYSIALPAVALLMVLAPEVVTLLAGQAFTPAIRMSQIVIPMLFVVGLAQVVAFQILIPKGYDRVTLIASVIGAVVGVAFNILLVGKYGAVGTCWTVVFTEICVTAYYLVSAGRLRLFRFEWPVFLKHLACCVPYVLFGMLAKAMTDSVVLILIITAALSIPFFYISQVKIIKNELALDWLKSLSHRK